MFNELNPYAGYAKCTYYAIERQCSYTTFETSKEAAYVDEFLSFNLFLFDGLPSLGQILEDSVSDGNWPWPLYHYFVFLENFYR